MIRSCQPLLVTCQVPAGLLHDPGSALNPYLIQTPTLTALTHFLVPSNLFGVFGSAIFWSEHLNKHSGVPCKARCCCTAVTSSTKPPTCLSGSEPGGGSPHTPSLFGTFLMAPSLAGVSEHRGKMSGVENCEGMIRLVKRITHWHHLL